MRVATAIVALVVGAFGSAAGCGSTQGGEILAPVVIVAPDDFVLRDVRKSAAHYLACQAPMIDVQVGAWAGSAGNVIAAGCGHHITYYLRCLTNHQCSMTVAD